MSLNNQFEELVKIPAMTNEDYDTVFRVTSRHLQVVRLCTGFYFLTEVDGLLAFSRHSLLFTASS